jgi:hypothetical protein
MERGGSRRASGARWIGSIAVAGGLLAVAPGARAIEFADGRVQIHGFYEAQLRSLVRDFDYSDDWDLTQWYNVLNIEADVDIAPDGIGPFDLVSGFGRVEVRYDCVWSHACSMFDSVDAYGHRAEKLPNRLIDGRRTGYAFQVPSGDKRHWYGAADRELLGAEFGVPVQFGGLYGATLPGPDGVLGTADDFVNDRANRNPLQVFQVSGFDGLFGVVGPDGVLGTGDDPAPFIFSDLADCRYGSRRVKGQVRGVATQVLVHSVDEDDCRIDPQAFLARKPNPFRGITDFYGNTNTNAVVQVGTDNTTGAPILAPAGDLNDATDGFGSAHLPLRPATVAGKDDKVGEATPRGIWYPNQRLQQLIRDGEFDNFDQNYDEQSELAWNRGASQQDTKELKELYLDLEAFDSRLWLRLGKQQIVWGKTELFRTTDQFNPQDLALGSLTSLEESRIALWSVRGIWSFFEVGPLEDVRLELGANVQDFEPADLGRCGEPYTPLPVCNKTFGLMAHGLVGVAVAGEARPDDIDESAAGLEYGGRLEFRAGRFSFAISDFFGFNDTPYADQIFRYSRNVDPESGRPRADMTALPCPTGAEPGCLIGRDPASGLPSPALLGPGGVLVRPGFPVDAEGPDALNHHSVNQNYFALICSTSIGFNDLDLTACGQSVFNSTNSALTGTPIPIDQVLFDPFEQSISELLANAVAGNANAQTTISEGLAGTFVPFTPLNQDPCDGFLADCVTPGPAGSVALSAGGALTVNQVLTSQQQALFGCGEFYGTNCELHGIDLLNAEASALLQSMFGIEGTPVATDIGDLFDGPYFGDVDEVTLPNGQVVPFFQPGTENFQGGPACTRYENGQTFILPGCRGPGDPGYDVNVDGSNANLFSPLIPGFQLFRSEMAAASQNFVLLLVALSSPTDPANVQVNEFDAADPNRHDGCSFALPTLCSNVSAFNAITGLQRNTVRAGGNRTFGRRDFLWHGGQDLILRYEKRNVLGFSADFAEDYTKTNWGFESTWIKGLPTGNNDEIDGLSRVNTFNVTLSVDRPTFINFMNANRTFFINSQWFLQYIDGYEKGMPSTGPYNFLGILNVSTGYFQDRLLPTVTFVYDVQSNSGAVLPSIGYRFTENFSATFGMAGFFGRFQARPTALTPASLGNRVGPGGYKDHVQNGLAVIEERDEFFLRVRYTF